MTQAVAKVKNQVALPALPDESGSHLDQITKALGVSRDVLADDESIQFAWEQLPRHLRQIPPNLRDERIVRMCIAVANGLFDAGINFIWNATILELREKVRRFGIAVIPQILDDRDFDEEMLIGLRDADLLALCLKLNLIGSDDYFFLDQCRATRNNFSAAHPVDGRVDEDEFLSFLGRCHKHALASTESPKGVNTKKLLMALKTGRFKDKQCGVWAERISDTHDAQRQVIFIMLHGIYCDASSNEPDRLNALDICKALVPEFSPKTKSALVDRHQEYNAKGDEERMKASLLFFEKIGAIDLLGEAEVHAIVTSASRKLLAVHDAFDNFYNEPPFAERLLEITQSIAVPETAQSVYVEAVITAAIGTQYGVSTSAVSSYQEMIEAFSGREIAIMFSLARKKKGRIGRRISNSPKCRQRFQKLVALIDTDSVPNSKKTEYQKWFDGL